MRSKLRSLRTQFVFPTLRQAFAEATRARADFRITQFSVQGDHVHLLVEADSKQALSRGMQGLAVRVARRLNRLISRSGKLWADRFFSRALTSPRAVRTALAYVLNNFKKHRALGAARIDPYSSAPYFDGFRELHGKSPCDSPRSLRLLLTPRGVSPPASADEVPIFEARTWLGARGWRKVGLIALAEAPADQQSLTSTAGLRPETSHDRPS
jgi:REP element-mobilizing transposase RayT